MSLGTAFDITTRTYTAKLRELLPFYFAMLGAPAVGLSVCALAAPIVVYMLSRADILDRLASVLRADAPIRIDRNAGGGPFRQQTDPGAGPDLAGIESVLADVPVHVTGTVFLAVLLAILLSVVVFAAVAAGRLHSGYACITDEPPVRSGVDGAIDHWPTLLWLYVAEAVASLLLLVLFPLLPLVHTFFAFARNVAVVDDLGTVGALGHTASFARSHWTTMLGYSIIAVGAVAGLAFVNLVLSAVRAPGIAPLLSAFVLVPVFDTFRTLLYAQSRPETTIVHDSTGRPTRRSPRENAPLHEDTTPREPSPDADREIVVPPRPSAGIPSRLERAIATGWSELRSFTRAHVGLVALSVLVFVAAVALGWRLTAPIDWLFEASIERRIAGMFPPGTLLNFFGNNWAVGIRQSLAGLVFGVPTIVTLVQNGLLIGALFRFEVAPTVLVAFLIPHGLVELPALWLSGALGLHLGRVGAGVARGRTDRSTLAAELDTAIDVLVGLGVLFAVAAVIEAFVSPYYWQPFLG